MVNHAIDDHTPSPGANAGLAADIAALCEPGAWLRFAPVLARAGLSHALAPSPCLWADWLGQASPHHHGRAQWLLQAMSRHRWHVQALATPAASRHPAGSAARLDLLLTVQSTRWRVSLAAVPRVHVAWVETFEGAA
jgi:hypothetical protein